MNKDTQNNKNKQILLSRFCQKSIRDLKSTLNDYLYNLNISLNLKRKSDINRALSLIDYNEHSNIKEIEISKNNLQKYLSHLTSRITELLNSQFSNPDNNYYWKASTLIISNKIYLLIKLYSDSECKQQIKSKLILILDCNHSIYSLKTTNPYYNTLLSSKKEQTKYTSYFLELNHKHTHFYLSKKIGLPTYPDIPQIKLSEIQPYLTYSILGCFNELLKELDSLKFLYKIPFKNCISLENINQKELESERWIQPMSQTEFLSNYLNSYKLIQTYYTYQGLNSLESYNWTFTFKNLSNY